MKVERGSFEQRENETPKQGKKWRNNLGRGNQDILSPRGRRFLLGLAELLNPVVQNKGEEIRMAHGSHTATTHVTSLRGSCVNDTLPVGRGATACHTTREPVERVFNRDQLQPSTRTLAWLMHPIP